jgi:hypothetical protein
MAAGKIFYLAARDSAVSFGNMKTLSRNLFLVAVLSAATVAFGGIPPVNVTVSNSGKAAFKGATDTKGTFATGKLQPGNYVVQFTSNAAGLKGNRYAIVVSAGAKKVAANGVAGEKLNGGGVAMKVDVGAGLNITGQVASEAAGATSKGGKKMVWIPKQVGSNIPGHWAEEDSAEAVAARTAGNLSGQDVGKMQEKSFAPRN